MSKSNITLLNYNNYYNRKVLKAGDAVSDYAAYVVYSVGAVNFYPADGVNTSLVLNVDATYCGNYLLVSDEYGNVLSRWFIMEARNVRNAQVDLTLKRDVMADFYDEIIDAPCFIEKATVGIDDIAIYNHENVMLNQIKTGEILLKDKTQSRWIVGYVAPPAAGETDTTVSFVPPSGTGYPSVDISDYLQYSGQTICAPATNLDVGVRFANTVFGSYRTSVIHIRERGPLQVLTQAATVYGRALSTNQEYDDTVAAYNAVKTSASFYSTFRTLANNNQTTFTDAEITLFRSLNDAIVYDDSKLWKITFTSAGSMSGQVYAANNSAAYIKGYEPAISTSGDYHAGDQNKAVDVSYSCDQYALTITEYND